jgi:hypothetical protein
MNKDLGYGRHRARRGNLPRFLFERRALNRISVS